MVWKKASLADLCDMRDKNGERCASAAQPYSLTLAGYPAGHYCKSHKREMTRVYEDARNPCEL